MDTLLSKLLRWSGAGSSRLQRSTTRRNGTAAAPQISFPPPEHSVQNQDDSFEQTHGHGDHCIEDVHLAGECPPLRDEIIHPHGPDEAPLPAPAAPPAGDALTAHLLGSFRLSINDAPIEKLPSGRSGSLLKYLIYHHHRRIPREALMEEFWPGAEPEVARNRLNVAMSNIRHTLRQATDVEVILFEDSRYSIHPGLQVWLDFEEMDACAERARQTEAAGRVDAAVQLREAAASLYQGEFLEDDLYDEWTTPIRERLSLAHLNTLFRLGRHYFDARQYAACAHMCQAILERDNCREDVHCLLMRCYARQNQFYLALRQYHVCVEALRAELDVAPAAATLALYEKLRRRELTDPALRAQMRT